MSGVAGGDRIKKQDVERTYNTYINRVLRNIDGFRKATLSGSVKTGEKEDYGDLDLVVLFNSSDKKEVKRRIISYINKQPERWILPFRSEKYKGKRYYNSGEIISILFPIDGPNGGTIQIDNIIALTPGEQDFKVHFLDLPAERQGLALGLAKAALLEEKPKKVFERLGIKDMPKVSKDEELEFNLSSTRLCLRKIKLENGEEVSREELWTSYSWGDVEKLLEAYDLSKPFEELLQDVQNTVKHPRSKRRIAGLFKSMVSVKSGEEGTEKGDKKVEALRQVSQQLSETASKETTIGLYAGGFKPPHKGHFSIAYQLSERSSHLIIFIGEKEREGERITAEQSKKIWQIYSQYLKCPVELRISKVSPLSDLYTWLDKEGADIETSLIGSTADDERKFAYIGRNRKKYPGVIVQVFETEKEGEEKISATRIRTDPNYMESLDWAPDELSDKDLKKVLRILSTSLEDLRLQEAVEAAVESAYTTQEALLENCRAPEEEVEEGSSGTAIQPGSAIPSKDRNELEHEFYRIRETLDPKFAVDFQGDRIMITIKDEHRISYDYTPYMKSILEYMVDKKKKIFPLPKIALKQDLEEASTVFGKTAFYDPNQKKITLYTSQRHPKDVLRSFTHEMVHHTQNLEGRINNIGTENINEDEHLAELEKEAYLEGNMLFRAWEDTQKNEKET